jgi:glycosidase
MLPVCATLFLDATLAAERLSRSEFRQPAAMKRFLLPLLPIFLLLSLAATGYAQALGNAWHIPGNTVPGGQNMRHPLSVATPASSVTIYNGNQFQGPGNPGDQSGGAVFFKAATDPSWQSVPLGFHAESGNDKFWKATVNLASLANAAASGLVQYYLRIDYNDGHAATYLHGTDAAMQITGVQATAQASPFTIRFAPELTVNGVSANYTTSKLYADEVAGESAPLTIVFRPNAPNVDPATVQVFTNLNRRDFATADANGDSIEDGIQPPHGDTVTTVSASYYRAYAMTSDGGGQYSLTLPADKCGAYRLTARYRQTGSPAWIYYSGDGTAWRGDVAGRRDHAITVAPRKTRDIIMYEANPLTIEATGTQFGQRSTFDDLLSAAQGDTDGFDRFNLEYLQGLAVNWLWFQPIHPQGIDGRQIDPETNQPFEVGSPYAVKNFFKINPLLGSDNTEADARLEFQNFVNRADEAGIHVMLDAPFNHTSYDAEVAEQGVPYFGGSANQELRNVEARFFSRDADGFGPGAGDYAQRAFGAGSIAVAPDRGDFGKFADTFDVFWGRYSALVNQYPADANNFKNEADQFLYDDPNWTSDDRDPGFQNVTHNVWKYFADYLVYWLNETGCTAGLSLAQQRDKGIDGLRADFGQGMPPQAWEYIINKTRARKWSFAFMAESLDGGEVTYRSNRHFDILNENIVFPLHAATTATDYRNIHESRRASYGQALVLLNSSSHDEDHYQDPFHALIRYAANSAIDGAPLIFPGQELGLSGAVVPPGDTQSGITPFGYDRYEINFGKPIPHFKKYNSLMPLWNKTNPGDGSYNYGLAQLHPVYAAIGQARAFSRALKSSGRFFLDRTAGGANQTIFAVAKYEAANAAPGVSDVVFAFANLDRNTSPADTFNVNITQGGSNLFGIKRGRTYNVRNIAAYTGVQANRRDLWLWGANGRTGDDVLDNGVFVAMNRVPTTDAAWGTAPYEAQYLKLYDVTPPPAPGVPAAPKAYAIGNTVTFSWSPAADAEGGVAGYELTVSGAGVPQVITLGAVTSYSFTGAEGQTLQATVRAINNAGIKGAASAAGPATILLSATGDQDGDGAGNASEETAGTDPLSSNSLLKILAVSRLAPNAVELTWTSAPGKNYEVLATGDLSQPFLPVAGGAVASAGTTTSFTDANAGPGQRFYKVRVAP